MYIILYNVHVHVCIYNVHMYNGYVQMYIDVQMFIVL